MSVYSSLWHANSNFYRERAEYLRFRSKLRPIRLSVLNQGTALASDVKFTIQVTDPMRSIELALGSGHPKSPRQEWSIVENIRPVTMNRVKPDIEIIRTKSGWTINAHFGKVQAKDKAVTSEELFVGASASGLVELPVSVFADELSAPVTAVLSVEYSVTEREVTVADLTK